MKGKAAEKLQLLRISKERGGSLGSEPNQGLRAGWDKREYLIILKKNGGTKQVENALSIDGSKMKCRIRVRRSYGEIIKRNNKAL